MTSSKSRSRVPSSLLGFAKPFASSRPTASAPDPEEWLANANIAEGTADQQQRPTGAAASEALDQRRGRLVLPVIDQDLGVVPAPARHAGCDFRCTFGMRQILE